MPVAAVTRLRLLDETPRLPFMWLSLRCLWQARWSNGNTGVQARSTGRNEYWTLTAWRDADALQAFVRNGTHRSAMPKLTVWCDESVSAHWEIPSFERPSWQAAALALCRYGCVHTVKNPSPAQRAGFPLGMRQDAHPANA